jgi:uncharacterized protein with GYD domain
MPTTSVRRLISPFSRSSGLVEWIFGLWSLGQDLRSWTGRGPAPDTHRARLDAKNQRCVAFTPRRISSSEKGRYSMPTFICFLNWTDQGAKAVKDAVARSEAKKSLITGLGGRLVCGYVTTGQYDVVLVVEMPNGDAMTKLAIALTSRGNVRTTTVRAFLPEEFGKLAAEAP